MDLPGAAWAFHQEQVDAAVAEGFAAGFDRAGRPRDPWLVGVLLVCPGGLSENGMSHRCRFVSVDGIWCFERAEAAADVIGWGAGPARHMRSVTVVAAGEGWLVESVAGRAGSGGHRLVEAVGWRVEGGTLVAVGRRRGGRYEAPSERER